MPFEHPLWVLYSSGTTGLPKAIVHGHGGIVLEHLKALSLHLDLGPGDVFFWYTTTGWMMWNFLAGGLLAGATVVAYDGSAVHPATGELWRLAAETGVTYFGTGAPYLVASMKAGLSPRDDHDLSSLRGVGSTGSPLPPEAFDWVYAAVAPHPDRATGAPRSRLRAGVVLGRDRYVHGVRGAEPAASGATRNHRGTVPWREGRGVRRRRQGRRGTRSASWS